MSAPAEHHVRLRDGTDVVIRPFQAIPRKDIDKAYAGLSPQSRYHRFLAVVPRLTDEMLHHLVDEIDGVNHIALVVVRSPDRGPESIIGIGRIIRYPHEPTRADVAVTIRDEWQGRGAATALLEALMQHRPDGVDEIVTSVAADNPAALAMLQRLGEFRATPAGIDTLDVTVKIGQHNSHS
ncbi:MAG TPA: GNAT family N-acetyltransferase [Microlunatus sp.]|nr:GNAT family N-acetyltransferase [Microlunatus sp.]